MIKYCGAKRRNCKKEKILTYNRGGFSLVLIGPILEFFFNYGENITDTFFSISKCVKSCQTVPVIKNYKIVFSV